MHVIIGVGPAGITAAQTILKTDKDAQITMISTDEFVHSRCMLHRYLSHERDEKHFLSWIKISLPQPYSLGKRGNSRKN